MQMLVYLFVQISLCQNLDNLKNILDNSLESNTIGISCPGDFVVSCDQNAQQEFNTWINSFGYSGGVNAITTDLSGYVMPQPGETLVVFYLVSDGNNFDYCKAKFKIQNCVTTFCTYTQGFYGNCSGNACSSTSGVLMPQNIMKNALLNHGGEFNFGSQKTGNYFKLKLSDVFGNPTVCNNRIYKMLPGGGSPRALVNFSTNDNFSTWSDNNPMNAIGQNIGKINNVLLSQTIALFFNLEFESNLSDIVLQPQFSTVGTTFCGSNIPVMESIQTFTISPAIINHLISYYGEATVGNLFLLANKALGNESIGILNHSKINEAVDVVNRAFDKCRMKVVTPNSVDELNVNKDLVMDFEISPVPFDDFITIKYLFNSSSNVTIQIYDLKGTLILERNDNKIYTNKEFRIEMPIQFMKNEMLYVKIKTIDGEVAKTIISK